MYFPKNLPKSKEQLFRRETIDTAAKIVYVTLQGQVNKVSAHFMEVNSSL